MKNNVVAYLLLACFGFSMAGFYPVFKVLQYELQKEIQYQLEAGIKENDLQVIEFRKHDKIDWVRQGKEFRISGQYYDVVLKKTEGDKLIFYCINDEQEKSLFAVLELLVNANLNEGKSADGPVSDFFSKIFTEI